MVKYRSMERIRGVLIGNPAFFGGQLQAFGEAGLALAETGAGDGAAFAAVGLPPREAFRESLDALRAGLHVVCAPPFCSSVTEHEELRAAAAEAGRTLFPVQPWSRSAAVRAIASALDNAYTGKPRLITLEAAVCEPAPRNPWESPLLYQAFAELLAAARRPPTALSARAHGDGRAAVCVQLGDIDGFVHAAWSAPAPRFRLAVSGESGFAETDGRSLLLERPGGAQGTEFERRFTPAADAAALAAELRDFRREMSGEAPRGGGLRNSRYCVKLIRNSSYSDSIRSACVPL